MGAVQGLRSLKGILPAPLAGAVSSGARAIRLWRDDNRLFGFLFDVVYKDYRIGDISISIPSDLVSRSFRSRFFFGTYEAEELELVRRFVKPGASVLELGACMGVVSCVTNRQLAPDDVHVVVEAHPALIETLETNRRRNGCTHRIEHGMVSNSSDGVFHLHDLVVGGSAVRETGRMVTVPVMNVEDLEAKHETRFSVLICDIEGGETALLSEFAGFFARVGTVIIEIHPNIIGKDGAAEVRAALAASGLRRRAVAGRSEVWLREESTAH